MFIPGHIAAGFLASELLLKTIGPELTGHQRDILLVLGSFFAFAPDLDMFFSMAREKAFVIRDPKKNNHRRYISHAPILWLLAGIATYFLLHGYLKYIGLVLWAGSFSHFLLDSIEHGIMWLWPLSKNLFGLKDVGKETVIEEKNFLRHWWTWAMFYIKSPSFYLEIILLIAAGTVFYNKYL